MANPTTAFGMRPIRHLNGNPWNGQTRKYLCEDAYGTAMYIGDCAVLTGTAPSDDASGRYPAIQRVTVGTTNTILGVITSFDPIDTFGNEHTQVYRVASTSRYANVCVDPDVVFIIRDDAGITLDGAASTKNAVLIEGTASTATGLSGLLLDAGTTDAPAATAADQLLIIGVWPEPNNTIGANCIWEVIISNHAYRVQTGILGV